MVGHLIMSPDQKINEESHSKNHWDFKENTMQKSPLLTRMEGEGVDCI